MKVLQIFLIVAFAGLAALATGLILYGTLSPYFIVLVLLCLSVVAALSNRGGKITRLTAYLFSCLLIFCGMLFIAMAVSLFFNNEYDSLSPVVLAVSGILGGLTFFSLKKAL